MVKARLAAQTSAHRSTARAQGTSLRIMICLPMPLILSHTSSVVHLLVTGFTWRFTSAAGSSSRALHLRSAIGWIISDLRKPARAFRVWQSVCFSMRRDPPDAIGGEQRRQENENVEDPTSERWRGGTVGSQRPLRTNQGDCQHPVRIHGAEHHAARR